MYSYKWLQYGSKSAQSLVYQGSEKNLEFIPFLCKLKRALFSDQMDLSASSREMAHFQPVILELTTKYIPWCDSAANATLKLRDLFHWCHILKLFLERFFWGWDPKIPEVSQDFPCIISKMGKMTRWIWCKWWFLFLLELSNFKRLMSWWFQPISKILVKMGIFPR